MYFKRAGKNEIQKNKEKPKKVTSLLFYRYFDTTSDISLRWSSVCSYTHN